MGKRGRRSRGRSHRIGGRIAIALAVAVACALWAAPARAADPYPAGDKSPPQVLAQQFFNGPPAGGQSGSAPSADAGGAAGSAGSGPLAFTGADILLLLLTALVASAIGFVLWRAARQRQAPSNR